MNKARLEAFSDGVLAIIITIMVLELRPPHGDTLRDLVPLLPKFSAYLLSFIMVGIYWGNHHHLLHTVHRVNTGIIWANLHLLFWLSLIPFVTAWSGEEPFHQDAMILYALVLLLSGVAYYILIQAIGRSQHHSAALAAAIKGYAKGTTLYVASNDRALELSKRINGLVARAGDSPTGGPLILPDIDTIDVTATSTDFFALNHSGYAERTALINDIQLIIQTGERPPETRVPILKKETTDRGVYWRYP